MDSGYTEGMKENTCGRWWKQHECPGLKEMYFIK
jgi:hypothetical protein